MNRNSLFAVLLRSAWWVSIAVAAAMFALTRMVLPADLAPYALFTALPFLIIGGVAGWRQLRAPSPARVAARLEAIRALGWGDFSAAIEQAFRGDGYAVSRPGGAAADLELSKAGRVSLVACKRWKATRTGVEPLRELDAARTARAAQDCIYISAGDITDQARAFAAEKRIRLLHDAELAALLPDLSGGKTT